MITSIDRKVIKLMAEGFSIKQMAGKMDITENSIETYRHRLFKKMKVVNAPHLIAKALRNKIIT